VKRLPKRIFVVLRDDEDDDGPYLIANENADSFESGERVGVYELAVVATEVVTHSLKGGGRS
jgi:hypothetical protein